MVEIDGSWTCGKTRRKPTRTTVSSSRLKCEINGQASSELEARSEEMVAQERYWNIVTEMSWRLLFICAALFVLADVARGEGTYQRTRNGKTLIWNNHPKFGDKATWS